MEAQARVPFVRPRVRSSGAEGGGTWLLEDAISERLERGETGVVWICGPAGSGKRSALAYLRARFAGDARVRVDHDTFILVDAVAAEHEPPTLRVRASLRAARGMDALELAGWSTDEQIEYLLARHPACCASVMQRLATPNPNLDLGRSPFIWAAVLEQLALDEGLPDEFEALRAALARAFGTPKLLGKARLAALEQLKADGARKGDELETEQRALFAPWLRHTPVLQLLAAEAIVLLLEKRHTIEVPVARVDAELLRVIRPLLLRSTEAREQARRMLESGDTPQQALAASLVHLEGPGAFRTAWAEFRSRGAVPARLSGARLEGAGAGELDLSGMEGLGIVLAGASLDGSDLSESVLRGAYFTHASLRGVRLGGADLRGADLRHADLERVDAHEANLEGARLDQATLRTADLHGARLERCSLHGACFEGADLSGAHLAGLDLRRARLATTRFPAAGLARANLEGQAIEAPDFSRADLEGALLSATKFPAAIFQSANLRNAGLAWIEWEGANLFGADLAGASFHLGSSRSGLVFNAPAGWGTRTGFYSDEYKEQGFKAPEEIRKANLRGADLRKANVFETDFYLVDLRDALYTPDQEKHLRGCGAILGS
jgi:uncharacterized protein YjbI with pentapeptide repeats